MAIVWQRLESRLERPPGRGTGGTSFRVVDDTPLYRAKVPGGWLLRMEGHLEESLTFLPDPAHKWNGSSLR